MILHFKYAVLPTEALTFVGYASLSIDGVTVCPNALIGRIIAGEEAFPEEAGFTSPMVSGASTIFGCPVINNLGGREPETMVKVYSYAKRRLTRYLIFLNILIYKYYFKIIDMNYCCKHTYYVIRLIYNLDIDRNNFFIH